MWILCLAEYSLETSSLIFSEKLWNSIYSYMSAAVVIGALRVKEKNMLSIRARETKFCPVWVASLCLFETQNRLSAESDFPINYPYTLINFEIMLSTVQASYVVKKQVS